jgi:glycolate oxidase
VVPFGGGTSVVGGLEPEAERFAGVVALDLRRMNALVSLDEESQLAVLEPGLRAPEAEALLRERGYTIGHFPQSFEYATLGGFAATRSSGQASAGYGRFDDLVLGVRVATPQGTFEAGRAPKTAAGPDLRQLILGSEGTLGVITAATLRLRPAPRETATVAAEFTSLRDAAAAVAAIVAAGCQPSLLELMDRTTLQAIDDWKNIGLEPSTRAMLIAQAEGPPDEMAARMADLCAAASFVAVSSTPEEAAELIGIRRLAYQAKERLGQCLVEDVCVPRSVLPEMITTIEEVAARHNVMIATVAHAGDGNVHPVFVFDRGLAEPPAEVWAAADEVFRAALDLGGTLTGEHGVGLLKKRWLELETGPVAAELHQGIKQVFDPLNILNPGKAI